MKITCTREKLTEAVENTERVITRNLTLPVLNNLLLKAEDSSLVVSATNLEIGVSSSFSCKISEKGEVTVPAKVFKSIVNNLEDDNVHLETKKETKLVITTQNYKGELKGTSTKEFPIIPRIEKKLLIKLNAQDLAKALSQVIAFTSFSETRPEITGILFQKNKEEPFISLVSTDSFRLAEKKVFLSKSLKEATFAFIIPQKTAAEVLRALGNKKEATIFIDKNQVAFELPQYQLISRLIEGTYPDYSGFIPHKFETEATFEREELVKKIRLVSLLSSRINDIQLSLIKKKEGKVNLYAQDPDLGENSSFINAEITGEPIEIGFNWHYLLEGLQHTEGKKVSLKFNDNTKPVLLSSPQDSTYIYIVMPIRV